MRLRKGWPNGKMRTEQIIAVTGAAGWIGREVCGQLRNLGHGVRPLTRLGDLPGGRSLDLTAPEGDPCWANSVKDCTAVIHCAAHVHRPMETARDKQLFDLVNVAGTEKLIAASARTGVGRFVLAGSSAVYDWSENAPKPENARFNTATGYSESKAKAESIVQTSSLDWRIARLGTVFGRGDTANFDRLARALKARRFVLPEGGHARKSVLTIERAAELLARLAIEPAHVRMTFNLASPQVPSLSEICAAFSRCCGFPATPAAPIWLLRVGAKLGDTIHLFHLPTPFTTGTLTKLTTSTVLDVTAMQRAFPGLSWPNFEETLIPAAAYYAAR
jgi:nucleoside-diphosphate-sugar epimerase